MLNMRASETMRSIDLAKDGKTVDLMGCLVAAGLVSLSLSTLSSVLNNVLAGVFLYLVGMLASNCLFGAFFATASKQVWSAADFKSLISKMPVQIAASLLVGLAQRLFSLLGGYAGAVSYGAQVFVSVCASLLVTLISAGIAFGLYSGQSSFAKLVGDAWNSIVGNAANVLYPALPFLAWSFLLNLGYAALASGSPSDVVMGLCNVACIVIAGYFEVDVLLGLAINYRRLESKDRKLGIR